MAAPFDNSGIIEFFLIEAGEHIQSLNRGLLSLERDPSDHSIIDELFRAAHTLKGSAAMMGFPGISSVAHTTEDMLGQFRAGTLPIRKDSLNFLFDSVDAIKLMVDGVAASQQEDMLIVDTIKQSYKDVVAHARAEGGGAPDAGLLPALDAVPGGKDELDLAWERTFEGDESILVEPILEEQPEQQPLPEPDVLFDQLATASAEPDFSASADSPKAAFDQEAAASQETAAEAETEAESGWDQVFEPPVSGAPLQEPTSAESPEPGFEAAQTPAAGPTNSADQLKQEIEASKQSGIPEKRGIGRRASDVAEIEKQFIRVNIERLDNLMNLVGEMVVNRNRLTRQVAVIKTLREELAFSQERLLREIGKFEEKYEYTLNYGLSMPDQMVEQPGDFMELEFDRYDDFNLLSRKLTEITNDTNEIMTELGGLFDSFELDTARISTVTSSLQDEVTMARMVEMDRLYQLFQRPLRDLCLEEKKQVNLVVSGGDTKLDKTIFEIISDPLMHMVRNAVSHGIEPVEERMRLGKDPTGALIMKARHEGNSIILEIEDDGRGMDPEVMRATAVEKSFLTADEAHHLSDVEALNLIFRPGFSTARSVGKVSGRGVGMDVVANHLAKINGRIEIRTEKGVGTRFLIRLPLTLAIAQALIVKLRDQEFAVPMHLVEETTRFSFKDVQHMAGEERVEHRGGLVRLLKLNDLLGVGKFPKKDETFRHPSLVLGMAERRIALLVEEIVGREEIVVKSLGDYLRPVAMFSGATISGEGTVRLILNVAALFGEETAGTATASFITGSEAQPAEAPRKKPKVLVVDDSISIRKYVQRFLDRAGYEVEAASDGMEALNAMGRTQFDVVITDLEMPVMHGYDLIAEMKRTRELMHIPVIVLTSRAGEKHRQKAIEMGARHYLVKPFEEQEMIEALKRVLSGAVLAHRA